jgi:hypothetical protein
MLSLRQIQRPPDSMYIGPFWRREVKLLGVRDISKLLAGVPKGAWVALSKDEERLVAFAGELPEALQKAKDAGEDDPVIIRVPEIEGTALIL